MAIRVNDGLTIPEEDLTYTFSRSAGPGGQNVNKVSSRVTVWFDLEGSSSLSADRKARIREKLSTRLTRDGRLHVSSRKHRGQAANRRAAETRLAELLAEVLTETPPRRPTRPSRRAKQARLEEKKRRSALKHRRSTPPPSDE